MDQIVSVADDKGNDPAPLGTQKHLERMIRVEGHVEHPYRGSETDESN